MVADDALLLPDPEVTQPLTTTADAVSANIPLTVLANNVDFMLHSPSENGNPLLQLLFLFDLFSLKLAFFLCAVSL